MEKEVKEEVVLKEENNTKKGLKEKIVQNKKIIIIASIVLVVLLVATFVIIGTNNKKEAEQKAAAEEARRKEEERYNNLPIKVDISMTSYYGSIDYILYELGLDFDLVTMGANCYTGVQKNEFETEKYGLLHTEFRYCKSNKTTVFRVYNSTNDQELREPKEGELPKFDEYGEKIKGNSNSL